MVPDLKPKIWVPLSPWRSDGSLFSLLSRLFPEKLVIVGNTSDDK